MKQGLTLTQMATELERQVKAKRDFRAPTKDLQLLDPSDQESNPDNQYAMRVNGYGAFAVTDFAHGQIAQRLGIPKQYYDRMKAEQPLLLNANVNTWLREEKEPKLVRTLDGKMRAFLSHKYRPLDYVDLAEVAFAEISRAGCRVESSALTDTKMYIKAVTERITFNVGVGDVVQAGIVISNSEVGLGSVKVEPMIFRLRCLNGMISVDNSLRKFHVGRGEDVELAEEMFQDATRKADDRAFWLKVRDVVRGSFNKEIFGRIVNKMQASKALPINGDLVKVVEAVTEVFPLRETERSGVLQHLIKDGDLSQYGLLNAITRTSQDVDDYDRATDLERFGGQVLELPKQTWDAIANAGNN